MDEELSKIINTYGVLNQVKKFNEEAYELTEAIFDYEYTESPEARGKLLEHILEEAGDVLVMVHQFIEYYKLGHDDLYKTMDFKIKRQLERIAMNEENY